MSKINVILAEDELALGMIIQESLESRDFKVRLCPDGQKAWESYQAQKPDVLVLDVMMPKKDGFSLAAEIRKIDPHTPIIFLTSKSQTEDVVKGFGLGANDYVRKPFSMEELELRVEAVLRRSKGSNGQPEEKKVFQLGEYEFDYPAQRLTYKGESNSLTTKEAELMKLLALNKNRVLEREIALKLIWGNDNYFTGRSMDVFITKLRKYLKDDPTVEIVNVHGTGYKLMTGE